jgi:hypothetical protein
MTVQTAPVSVSVGFPFGGGVGSRKVGGTVRNGGGPRAGAGYRSGF